MQLGSFRICNLIGTSNGGLCKTEDGGLNWRLLTQEYAFGITKIIANPTNSNIMFAVTGIYANSLLKHGYYGQGIFKSTDAGEHGILYKEYNRKI